MEQLSRIENLNGTNYPEWSLRMELCLKSNRLWEVVDCPPPEQSQRTDQWHNDNFEALGMIVLRVDDHQLDMLADSQTAHQAWQILHQAHLSAASQNNRIGLLRKLIDRKCGLMCNLDWYLDRFKETTDQLEAFNVDIPQGLLMAILLNGLPRSFYPFTLMVECQEEEPTMDHLIENIRREGDRLTTKGKVKHAASVAYTSSVRCGTCRKIGHVTKYCWYNASQ